MAAIITKKFRIHNTSQFVESFSEVSPTRYYLFVGRITAYANDSAPGSSTDTVQNTEFDGYRDMIALKRVQPSDVSYSIPRYNWTTATVYKQYTDTDASLFPTVLTPTSNTTFYVLTEDMNVYKCIDNARGAPSTVKPTGTDTNIVSTADGYRWKFMYRITAAESLKFLTTNYMPVATLTANNGSSQWQIQGAAANGAINHYVISANGTGYLSTKNTFSSISNSSVVKLNTNASGTDNIYNGSTIFISAGLGAGQLRRIVDYAGSTRLATVNGAFTTSPNTSSSYIVGPNVIIKGDSGGSVSTRATAYVSNCAGGQIRKITGISTGLHYSQANCTISANSSWGSGAIISPIISPPGGHGSDPVGEFGGYNAMINVQIIGTEANTFPANNDFRVIGIIKDPILRSGPVANASVIDQCTRITVTGLNGDLRADEIITGGTSGAKSRLVYFANTNAARTAGILRVLRVSPNGTGGLYVAGETITGANSGKTATVASLTSPALKQFSGDIIYTENRLPITRASDQIEDFKLVFKF